MPAATGVYVVKHASIQIDSVEYGNQHTKAQITVDQSTQTTKAVDGTVYQDTDTPAYNFEISALQGDSLWSYLREMAGQSVEIVFTPKPDGTVATFSAIAVAPNFGDEAGKFAAFEMTLPIIDAPDYSGPGGSV